MSTKGHKQGMAAKRPRENESDTAQSDGLEAKRSKLGVPSLTIITSEAPTSDSLFDDSGDALDDDASETDSLFDYATDDNNITHLSAHAIPSNTLNPITIPAALRTAPPIPGLFFDPSILLPTELADQVLHQCKSTYFQNPSTNQVMLFGRAYDPSSSESSIKPTNSGIPPFLQNLLCRLEELLRLSLPSDIHKLLFPPPSEPSRARQAIINLYRPGEGITPHVDLLGRFGDGIIGISLGSGCVMAFRRASPSEEKGGYKAVKDGEVQDEEYLDEDGERKRWDLYLPVRSVLVMSGDARYRWMHGIERKEQDFVERESASGLDENPRGAGEHIMRSERLSITFRWLLPGAEVVGGSEAS